jgi:DNA-binding protein HU-beta/integration host factor subunit alpha
MLPNLTKRQIVLGIYEKTDVAQKDIKTVVQLTLDAIGAALAKGQSVELRNFGVFEVRRRKARMAQNPKSPQVRFAIPPKYFVRFKAGKELAYALDELAAKEPLQEPIQESPPKVPPTAAKKPSSPAPPKPKG